MGEGLSINYRRYFIALAGVAIFAGFYLASRYNYLLFHVLGEFFSIAVACGIFMVAWNSRRFLQNNYILFLGVSFLFVAGLDLTHTLTYKGMNIFRGYDTNLPTQLWISARYMGGLSFLIAPLFLGRTLNVNRLVAVYAGVFTLLLLSIFGGVFPVCFVEGVGLTPFKKISEYIISLILVAAIFLLHKNRGAFDRKVLHLLYAAIVLNICSELAFTFYVSAYGFSSLVGHYLKIVSFFLIYKAVIETGLREPYSLLFRDLKQSEEALHGALEESRRRSSEVAALLEGARAVLEYRDFTQSARLIFDSCKKTIGATAGYVALLSKDGAENEVLFLDAGGLPCTVDPLLPMPIRGLRAEAYKAGKVVYDNGFSNSEWMRFMPGGHVTLENVLFAPLVIKGRTVGIMGIANKEGGFTDDDARIAAAFGELAAVSLHNSRTLESLEESEERFRSVSQSANDAIISSDRNGNIIFWNPAAEAVFGYSADEAIGKPLTVIMPASSRQAHEGSMARIVSTGKLKNVGKTVELTGLRKGGTEFPIELSIAQWKTKEGVFFTAIIRDITERKQAEEELKRYREHLEEIVKERTAELITAFDELEAEIAEREKTEAQLFQSRKMEAVGQLAGGIAHDFNNRLFAIRNYAHILKTKGDEQAADIADGIFSSCNKAAHLIDELMQFSRKKAINPRPVDLNNIVREAEDLLRVALGKNIKLDLQLADEQLTVIADNVQMEHVLINLATNAKGAMPEGGRVTVRTERVGADAAPPGVFDGGEHSSYALVSVTDTGPGMDERTRGKIFEPFFTTKEAGEGTGLGLSIVYSTVRQHGGCIEVQSEPGKGATFKIYLPMV